MRTVANKSVRDLAKLQVSGRGRRLQKKGKAFMYRRRYEIRGRREDVVNAVDSVRTTVQDCLGWSSVLGRERSGEGIEPEAAEIACSPLTRWQMGRHKAGSYGGETGDGAKQGRRGRTPSHWPQPHCGASRTGGVAGAEPPHKGGPNRPDRPRKLQRVQPSTMPEIGSGDWK